MREVSNKDFELMVRVIRDYLDVTDESTMAMREKRRMSKLLIRKLERKFNL